MSRVRCVRLVRLVGRSSAAGLALALAACGAGGGGGFTSDALVTFVTTDVPAAQTGQEDYSFFFEARVPHSPGTFGVSSGTIPPGMRLDTATGELHGVPRAVGTFSFTVVARDGVDPVYPGGGDRTFAESSRRFTMTVGRGAPNLLAQAVPSAQYRNSYSFVLDAAGGTPPYVFSDVSAPPDGLGDGMTLSPNGVLGNFPTETGPFRFVARVTDADGSSDEQAFSVNVVIKPLLILTPSPLQSAAAEFPYQNQFALASNGGGEPIVWSQVPPVAGETLLSDIDMEITPAGVLRHVFGAVGPRRDASGPYVPPYTVHFTLRVTDEALQPNVTRAYALTVNPGPVLTSISPNRSVSPGPYQVTGLNFQSGASLVFRPGPNQVVVNPTFVSATRLTFAQAPAAPGGVTGAVPVAVVNPDGGTATLAGGFVYPASNVAFGTKGFLASSLSSTGLDCADVNGDGFADVVHCGAVGLPTYPGGPASTSGGLVLHLNAGSSTPAFGSTPLDAGSYYDVKFADVNLDGRKDVVALAGSSVRVWLNGVAGDPPGTFSAGPVSATSNGAFPSEMSFGFLDGDPIPDLAFGYPLHAASEVTSGRVYSMSGTGTGAFVPLDAALTTVGASYGVGSVVCVDTDADGVFEVASGTCLNLGSGAPVRLAATMAGLFGPWADVGGLLSTPAYGQTTCLVAGDFLGTGQSAVVSVHCGSPNYSDARVVQLLSGPGLTTVTPLPAPSNTVKSGAAIDADFDLKSDWAVTTAPSSIVVYRGSTLDAVATLDASVGTPALSAPLTGRVASGDVDGDGRADLLATTSSWIVNGMATQYGSTYVLGKTGVYACSGDGGTRGIVFFLNASN
jgi:hypothetical protein